MTVAAPAFAASDLSPEWRRLELLARHLAAERQGQPVPETLLEELAALQRAVLGLRQRPPWQGLLAPDWDALAGDVLACVLAPEAEPRLGWLYQQLQAGAAQPYPSFALIQELLALDATETARLRGLLDEDGPLRRAGLIQGAGDDPFQPLRPGAALTARLLGRRHVPAAPPGAVRVPLRATWAELVLPADRRAALEEFLHWIRQREVVVGQWGGRELGGPVALFTGPSGTGKTFAAAVLAGELGWPLYRVDLGGLVSKYVGETEKNLNRLFDAAHGREMVLLFDEADALFAKRGEVKEARDRYANMEVSHLLARIEAHRGPVILTSNLRQHLDPAFTRRFQVVVDFPRPDAGARAELWRRALPPRAPLSEEVDPHFLGQAVSLTGGAIRNAALHAAYLAAAGDRPLGLGDLALAVWRELGKDGREVSRVDLGRLGAWLEEGLA